MTFQDIIKEMAVGIPAEVARKVAAPHHTVCAENVHRFFDKPYSGGIGIWLGPLIAAQTGEVKDHIVKVQCLHCFPPVVFVTSSLRGQEMADHKLQSGMAFGRGSQSLYLPAAASQ